MEALKYETCDAVETKFWQNFLKSLKFSFEAHPLNCAASDKEPRNHCAGSLILSRTKPAWYKCKNASQNMAFFVVKFKKIRNPLMKMWNIKKPRK